MIVHACTEERTPYLILCFDMFFGPGKRKGYSSFKVVDRSNKSLKSIVNLPSALPPEQENTVQEHEESSYSYWGPDDASEDQEDKACSSQYKTIHCLSIYQETFYFLLRNCLFRDIIVPGESN